MLYGVGEVLQGADGCLLLRWVLGGAIALCQVRDDHLDVALGTQCPGLQEGLAVVHTAPIHVESWRGGEGGMEWRKGVMEGGRHWRH